MAKPAEKSRPPTPEPVADHDYDPSSSSLEKFRLYETRARFYLIGCDRRRRFHRVLKIDRSEPSDLNISEDPMVYTQQEVKSLLQRIAEGNRATGGLASVGKVYGIAGCIKFLESYYLILVTKRRQIGAICGHAVYRIEESQMISVPHSSIQSDVAHCKTELRYKKLLSSVDLTKDFFYSYTYPIMQSLQKNVAGTGGGRTPYDNMFVWNAYLTEAIRSRCSNTLWTIALVHGDFEQVRLSIYGREFIVSIISRRSRYFAGTRYLKRGVNDRGWVANDVETEQIVIDEETGLNKGKMSSVVQVRGSIPLFWSQEASRFSPKPDIILQRYDPTYQATKLHFEDLYRRYGNPIIVLNLIKTVEKRPREMMLRREFATAVGYLNQILPEENHLKFIHWDFHKFAKSKSANVLAVLGVVASEALDLTGFYYSGKPSYIKKHAAPISRTSTRDSLIGDPRANSGDATTIVGNVGSRPGSRDHKELNKQYRTYDKPHYQSGVLRTNCIDCLDRTNVAQYAYGLAALGRQLHAMGLADSPKVDPDSSIATTLMDMYQNMGDVLAQQYGGSAAHNTVFPERQGKWKATTQSREFIKSIRRYYSNAYTDGEKQDAINLFLGYFKPQEGKPALWELDSDYYLHVTNTGVEPVPDADNSSPFVPKEEDDSSFSSSRSPSNSPMSGIANTLAPIPACRKDFTRLKLTSFQKLLETSGSSLKNVRLCSESDSKTSGIGGTSGMAPDAAEIQLKTPNWLYGQRKSEDNASVHKISDNAKTGATPDDFSVDQYWDSSWLDSSYKEDDDTFKRYLMMAPSDGDGSWFGGELLYGQDENSGVYKHYAALCQGPAMELFGDDEEKEKHYGEALHILHDSNVDEAHIQAEMDVALKEYDRIGDDLGMSASCRSLAEDPCKLTRWIIGEEKIPVRGR